MSERGTIIDGVRSTPLELAENLSAALGRMIYIKRDDQTHARYGGNKARKLVDLLGEAIRQDATDVLTFGAAGSHHVLATAIHGASVGLGVHAVVLPHPSSADALACIRASVAAGCQFVAARGQLSALYQMWRLRRRLRKAGRRPYLIAPGGSSALGSVGFFHAARELGDALPGQWPRKIFCAVGSGGTCAGLLAGLHHLEAETTLVGTQVREGSAVKSWYITRMARKTHALAAPDQPIPSRRALASRLHLTDQPCGRCYGHVCPQAEEALGRFAADGIHLEHTYSAKAAASLLHEAERDTEAGPYVFWLTFAPPPPTPHDVELPSALGPLLLPASAV